MNTGDEGVALQLLIYVDYRMALLDLMTETFYDFEKNRSLIDQLNDVSPDALSLK